MQNNCESVHIDYSNVKENTVRIDVRWTVKEKDELACLIMLREKADALIFEQRMRLKGGPTAMDGWDGDETDKVQY